MHRRLLFAIAILFLFSSCLLDDGDRRRAEWRQVQELRKEFARAAPAQRVAAKQKWADEVRRFLVRWPDHPGAARTWNELQLDYAEQLEANGHFRDAELHYRNLLERLPAERRASEGVRRVTARQSLSRSDFEQLSRGMSSQQVARLLGLPRPGWERHEVVDGKSIESWYYRGADGVVRGVHFREGSLFEIDPQ